MHTGGRWTGREVAAFRQALGMKQEPFATHTGVSTEAVKKWEKRKETITLSVPYAARMDRKLEESEAVVVERFWSILNGPATITMTSGNQFNSLLSTVSRPEVNTGDWHEEYSSTIGQSDEIVSVASQSMAFAQWAAAERIDSLTIDSLAFELTRIATAYVASPVRPLFRDLVVVRDQTWKLLKDRPQPTQARELYFLAGVCLTLLAHSTQNLGNSMAAMQEALAAEVLAVEADHDGLRAWVAGTQALIAEWSGQPRRAVDFAASGLPFAPPGDQRARLAALHARCAARCGDAETARRQIHTALAASEESPHLDELQRFGGVLAFPAVKAHYYAAGTYALIGDFDDAERMATAAIDAYESGPPEDRSYGDEALARVDVAVARLGQDNDIEGATEAVQPVLNLPADQRIRQINDGLLRIRRRLSIPELNSARPTTQLRDQIDMFSASLTRKAPR